MTHRILLAALPLALPALAGPDCKGMAQSKPMWEVARAFEEPGARSKR